MPFDELDKLIEGFCPHDVETLRSDPAFVEKARRAQYAEVLGDGRSGHLEPPRHRPGIHFSLADKLHDLEPSRVAQSPDLGQHRHYRFIPCKFYFT
jgi:hypothetical protein